jgi:hypothetical protein
MATLRTSPVLAPHVFREHAWERRRRSTVDHAFRTVPFYREQWARAGRAAAEPEPVPAADLSEQLFRLCPLTRPWKPNREPSLWVGDPRALADALALAGVLPGRSPVLEVRRAMVDWRRLTIAGNPYGVLLSPDADVWPKGRLAMQLRALLLAQVHGGATVVGSPSELTGVLDEADVALGGTSLEWTRVHRLTLTEAQVAPAGGAAMPAVVHDPFIGYLASRVPDCGEVHLLWKRVHCASTVDGLAFTRLCGHRPALVNVLPVNPGFSSVGRCSVHGTPVLAN